MATLEFLGRGFVYSHHLGVPHRLLEVDDKKSFATKEGKPNLNDNLIVQGDNLHALKALMPLYEGQIKCIYIDPPYNTGNEGWAYNDKVNSPLMQDWLGKTVDRDDQCRHDKWLCMMWPRLNLLHDLLSEDGVIFISIDDNEQHRLRAVMDEIFGEKNFIGDIIRKTKSTTNDTKNGFNIQHENCITYAKNSNVIRLQGEQKDYSNYKNPDNDPMGIWINDNPSARTGHLKFPITNPHTKKIDYPPQGRNWGFSEESYKRYVKSGKIKFKKNHKENERGFILKRYLSEIKSDKHQVNSLFATENAYMNQVATKEKNILLKDNIFDYPKPSSFLQRIVSCATNKDSIILDSFAGSGTTAHAVLALNKEDGGNRKFILIECEDYADSITAERVRRVIKGVPNAKDETLKNGLGGSFTYVKLGDPIDHEMMLTGESLPAYEQLARHVFWTATSETFTDAFTKRDDGFIGESARYRIYLIYKPDIAFLGSNDATLSLDKVKEIRQKAGGKKRLLVFAPVSFMSKEDLEEYRVTFCQLPWAINDRPLQREK